MRLIDADAIKYHEYLEPMGNGMYVHGGIVDDKEIDAMPTVDAVPVVRCRDCVWYIIDQLKSDETPDRRYKPTFCELHRTWMPSDGFCSVGIEEKK